MSATTRWVRYDVSATGSAGLGGTGGLGTRGKVPADGAPDTDTFNIGSGNNRLRVIIDDGQERYVTLASGTNLDPRFVAKDISEKLHTLGSNAGYDHAQCVWENGKFVLYSGSLGSGSDADVISGSNTAHLELGWGTSTPDGGEGPVSGHTNWVVTVSGTYDGFFDEIYKIVINVENPIQEPTPGGSNSYLGTISTGGAFNYTSGPITYVLSTDIINGSTMGGGTGGVPKISWTSTNSLDDGGPIELLYPNYWYQIGTKGLMVKFTEGVFNGCDPAWTIVCNQVQDAWGSNNTANVGNAMYMYGSNRGDDSTTSITCQEDQSTQLGTRGLYIKFVGTGVFTAGDEFYVVCKPPQPIGYDITNLDYGNVTVSTESPVKCVMFEIMSGAVEISTVKFGLQSHGTFEHHREGSNDTYFRFGTVGPGQPAGAPSTTDGLEWRANVIAADIDSDNPPAFLYATKANLIVVSDADASETIGSSGYMGMTSDPIFVNVRLGASEVGANSLINSRTYFDYS